jgi:hypothetical protein
VSSKSKLRRSKKRYSDYNIKREGESTIDFSTRLNAHIVASKNKSAKTGASNRQKRERTTTMDVKHNSKAFQNDNKSTQLIITTTIAIPCNVVHNNATILNESLSLESVEDFIHNLNHKNENTVLESPKYEELDNYNMAIEGNDESNTDIDTDNNNDLKTKSETEQLCALWTENKQLAHEVFNMQEEVRNQTFDCNIRSMSELNASNSDNRKRSPFFLHDPQFDLPLEEQTQEQRNRMNQNDITRNIFICNT